MLTTKQAADRLNVCEQRVKQLIYLGKLKAEKFGQRAWAIDEGSVEARLAALKAEEKTR